MQQATVMRPSSTQVNPSGSDVAFSLTILLFVAFFVFVAIHQLSPPSAVSAAAPATDFSSARAMRDIEAIAQKPHPMGSPEHAAVRDYILGKLQALGLKPEVQRATAINENWGNVLFSGAVENVMATLKGTDSSKSIIMVSHYDSVPTSPGASDNGSGVAVLLETARALLSGPALKNDVIFLFTDGEEYGLLGAKAFVDEHPQAKNAGIVLNFEANGAGGPAIMFETSPQNGWLIREFSKAAPHPVANSLSYEIYKLMPRDTDLSVFKWAGYECFNFAFIDSATAYHNPLDNLEKVDERSIQHQGSYALSLTRHFGSLDLPGKRDGDAIYFSSNGSTLFYYSGQWAVAVALLTTILFVGVVILGLRRRELSLPKIALGSAFFLLSALAVGIAVMIVFQVLALLHSGDGSSQGRVYGGGLYITGFIALALFLMASFYAGFRKKVSVADLSAGAMFWWVLLMILSVLYLPGGSYLFTWPLFFSLVGLALLFLLPAGTQGRSWKSFTVLCICAVPAVILFTQIIYLAFTAMGMAAAIGIVMLVVLLVGLLIPHLSLLATPNRWLLPGASALASICLIVIAGLTAGPDRDHPIANNIFYALNADSGKATWISTDERPDEWTSQFLSSGAERAPVTEYLPSVDGMLLTEPAPALPLTPANINLVDDHMTDGIRHMRLRLTSSRQSPVVALMFKPESEIEEAWVNGKRISRKLEGRWGIQYFGIPPEGIELALQLKPGPVQVQAVDLSYGLPELPASDFKQRPDYMVPTLFPFTDSVIVSKSFVF